MMALSLLVGVLAFTSLPLTAAAPSIARATACNGHAELCDRKYSNITMIGTHDSAFVGVLPTDNQLESVSTQLDAGIRFLQAQTHWSSSADTTIELCHTTCLEKDAGGLLAYLNTVKTWLDTNPDEVVTFLVTNQDAIPVASTSDQMPSKV